MVVGLVAKTALIATVVLAPNISVAAETAAADEPTWLKIASGLVAIASTVFTIMFTIVSIRKMRFDQRNSELEADNLRAQKQIYELDYAIKLKEAGGTPPVEKVQEGSAQLGSLLSRLVDEVSQGYAYVLIVVRFIVLSLSLTVLYALQYAFSFLFTAAETVAEDVYGFKVEYLVQDLLSGRFTTHRLGEYLAAAPFALFSQLPDIARLIVVVLVGIPLLKDISGVVDIRLRDFFISRRRSRRAPEQ